MKNIIKYISFGLSVAALIVLGFTLHNNAQQASASIQSSEGYYATTTNSTFTGSKTIRSGYGMLGSVVIAGVNTGTIQLYDATTTDITLRTGNKATSTILIAEIPASTAAGTYTYDVNFNSGLVFVGAGSVATSTITFK